MTQLHSVALVAALEQHRCNVALLHSSPSRATRKTPVLPRQVGFALVNWQSKRGCAGTIILRRSASLAAVPKAAAISLIPSLCAAGARSSKIPPRRGNAPSRLARNNVIKQRVAPFTAVLSTLAQSVKPLKFTADGTDQYRRGVFGRRSARGLARCRRGIRTTGMHDGIRPCSHVGDDCDIWPRR